MGFYIDITKIDAPSSAEEGSPISIRVTAKNKSTTLNQYILVMGRYDTIDIYASPEYTQVGPQATQTFTISFNMPSHSIIFGIWGFIWIEYPDQPGYWYQDTYNEVSIEIKIVKWIPLASKLVAVSVTPTAWIALAATSITLTRISTAWVALASMSIPIKVSIATMWIQLAQTSLQVKGIPHNWIMLRQASTSIKALPPIKKNWVPIVAGIGAVGLAAYAITRRD